MGEVTLDPRILLKPSAKLLDLVQNINSPTDDIRLDIAI